MAVGGRGLGKISFMSATQNGKRSKKLDCKTEAGGMHFYLYAKKLASTAKKGKVKVCAHLPTDV